MTSLIGWTEVLLRDICDRIDYGYTASAKREPVGPKFLRITDIVPDLIDWSTVPYCEIDNKSRGKYALLKDDIVLARTGATTGYAKRIRRHIDSVFASYLVRIRVNGEHDPAFVGHIVESDVYKRFIQANLGGSAQPQANAQVLTSFPMSLPPLPTQRRIASILSAYDDLIENNTRRIAILEEMAQSLYREWFVHFRLPGHEHVPLVDSPLGPVPEGWEIAKLSDFGRVITGKTPSKQVKEYFGGFMPFIKLPDMHGNMFCLATGEGLSEQGMASQRNKTLPTNSICVSCIGTAGIVTITSQPSQTNQQINSIVLTDLADREYLYCAITCLRETINQYGANGATMVNLNKAKFESLQVVRADIRLLRQFHDAASGMFDSVRTLQAKNANLRRTRDLLLPKLITGNTDVT